MTTDQIQAADAFNDNVYTLFHRQAREFSDKIAVIAEDESVTYGQLAVRSTAIAEYLAQRVSPEQTVGVFITRSVDMIAAMLGIWKAGGAYVPLDPNDPAQRNRRILDIANCEIVLVHPELTEPPGVFDTENSRGVVPELVNVREISTTGTRPGTTEATEVQPGGKRLAYVMFTSGSSGTPKGVEVEHRSLASCLSACRNLIESSPADCFLAASTIGFDASVAEIFVPLTSGGTILLRSHDIVLSPKRLAAEITEFGVTVFQAVPSIWSLIIAEHPELPKLRVAISAGEAISNELASKLIPYADQVWNLYGPTEATVYASACRITRAILGSEAVPAQSAPIGRPLANATMIILGPDRQPVPHGERGELFIGGAAVARGYCNAQAMTQKAFVQLSPSIGRTYRTGDVAALREDGELVFCGRNDDQLKIRGVRVEPGEIKASLIDHPAVSQAAVTWFAKPNEARSVVAAIVLEPQQTIEAAQLREWLSLSLRSQMIPEYFSFVEQLPRFPSGKSITHKFARTPKH